jgi:DNA-binding NarL/FixJ family response regulator
MSDEGSRPILVGPPDQANIFTQIGKHYRQAVRTISLHPRGAQSASFASTAPFRPSHRQTRSSTCTVRIAALLGTGMSVRDIAEEIGISNDDRAASGGPRRA